MQHIRAVRVEDALGIAGRTARVAEPGGGTIVELGVVEPFGLLPQKLLVAECVRERSRFAVAHDHVVLDRLEPRRDLLEQRHQRVVYQDDLVLGVVGDIGELLLEQADVEGVEHRAHAGDAHVRLQVALRVPGERGDPIPVLDAESPQRAAQAVDAVAHLGVAGARGPVVGERHHLAVAVHPAHAPQDVLERERVVVLNETLEHSRMLPRFGPR